MKTLPLVIAPDPFLKKISQPVIEINDEIRNFMNDMLNTMYQQKGIGLASVQVGVLKRIIVMDVDYEIDKSAHHHHHHHDDEDHSCLEVHVKNTNPQYFINPEILESSTENSTFNEGCLSFPGARADVIRPESIKLKYLDYNGREHIKTFTDISATCLQHEIDHLNGINFVDRISSLKKEVILKKIKKGMNVKF